MRIALMFLLVSLTLFRTTAPLLAEKIVVAMNPLAVSEDAKVDSAAVSAVLQTELSAAEKITLVDREDMNRALNELKLSQQGMIATESTRALGKIVGANYFFSGNVKKAGDKVMATVRVIEIETTLVKMAYTFIDSAGDVEAAGKELASQVEKVIMAFEADKAEAVAKAAASEPTAKPIPVDWERPTVMVIIPEIHVRQPQLIDPAGETEIVKRLIAEGFTVIDSEYVSMMKRDQAVAKKAFGSLKTTTEYAAKRKVDVLLYGEAISERGAALADFVGCRGRIELKAIAVADDRILASDSAEGGATDLSEAVAGKKAIKQAANKLADTFLYALADSSSKN